MSLLEQEAIRMATALDDYEHLRVTDMRGDDAQGVVIVIRDQRLELDYEIYSHADYWDFLGYFCSGKQWPVKPLPRTHVA